MAEFTTNLTSSSSVNAHVFVFGGFFFPSFGMMHDGQKLYPRDRKVGGLGLLIRKFRV